MSKKALTINIKNKKQELQRELRELEKKATVASAIVESELPRMKAAVYNHLDTLANLGVAEDYTATLLHTAATCGENGVRLPLLRKVLLDQVTLDDARKQLGSATFTAIENGKTVEKSGSGFLTEKADGNSVVIKITEAGKSAFEAVLKSITTPGIGAPFITPPIVSSPETHKSPAGEAVAGQ